MHLKKVGGMSSGFHMAFIAVSSSRMVKGEVSVVRSSGGELESALFCQTKALAFPVFFRSVRPMWVKGSQNAVEWED